MAIIEITLSIKQDGVELFGTPIHRRVVCSMATGGFTSLHGTGGGYTPTAAITVGDIVQMVLLQPDRPITVRLNGQADAGIPLAAQGLLLLLDTTLDSGPTSNVTIDNESGEIAVIRGAAGGTV